MELTDLCIQILGGTSLEDKLFFPTSLTDEKRGPARLWDTPSRPAGMSFQKHTRKDKLPSFLEHKHTEQRAVCLHRFAGHELLAVECMAYALLAFPEAPSHFRRGLANTLREEQEHVRLYRDRLKEMGVEFGDLPLYKHFWSYTPFLKTPLEYVSVMSLTFEMANLDFAPLYRDSFTQYGDIESAKILEKILQDEIGHVKFGISWLNKFKPEGSTSWQTWRESVPDRLPPNRAKGPQFFSEYRKAAGVPEEWLSRLQ